MLEVSMREEIITLEEGVLLITGILFGWLAGIGFPAILVLIPVALFIVFILDSIYKKKKVPEIKKMYKEHMKNVPK